MNQHNMVHQGLTQEEVKERIRKGQSNNKGTIQTKTIKRIIYENIWTLFNVVNFLLAIAVAVVHSYRNMLFMGVVMSNILIGIIQEMRAKRIIDRLSILSAAKATVVRDNQMKEIPMQEIVLDDVMSLKSGTQICADAVVLSGECEVNESLLTGESDSVTKRTGEVLLSGSYLVSGCVFAKVIKVGSESYANKITSGAKYIKKVNSEIKKSIMWIVRMISIMILPIALLLYNNQMQQEGQTLERGVVSTVAALIGMIPEGLVLLTSIMMAVSVIRLGKQKALVQEPYCVETLARVDVFCMDKTGTITRGDMEVIGSEPVGAEEYSKPLQEMVSVLQEDNPTFQAVKRKFAAKPEWNCQLCVPFSSDRKWSLTAFEEGQTYILGAPEFVYREMEESLRIKIREHMDRGERVLLFACSRQIPEGKSLPADIRPLALLYLDDRIREKAYDTIRYLNAQGVNLKVISGDNPRSVAFIAQKAGVPDAHKCIDCSALSTEAELRNAAENYCVFGRVSPEQKLCLMKELRKRHIVAMIGDGVNDVLALKEADCGIAMQSGSEAARNVSEIVLLNSDFSSIPSIIAEGRRTINNLTRSASLFLVKTTSSCVLAVLFCFLSMAYPFQPIQMTLTSAVCIGIPSFLLALEKNHTRVKPGFLQSVLKVAVPGGLLAVANILFCVLLQNWIPMNVNQIGTLAMYSCALVFSVILYRICYPFNRMRKVMYGSLVGIYLIAVICFKEIFYIESLSWKLFLLILLIEGLNIILYKSYHRITKKIKEVYHCDSRKSDTRTNL